MEISLCMIVKDEAAVLGRCLESAAGVADEIVVVDTGSADGTREIAAAHGARVYDYPWNDDFAAARNFSFSKGTKEYLMWLDADDVLLERDRAALLRLKRTLDPSVDLVMLLYDVGAPGGPPMSYYRERLMRRDRHYEWKGAVHEVVAPSGNLLYLPIAVTHRKTGPGDPGRNLRIYEGMLRRGEALEPRQRFYYARELLFHARFEEAAREFRRFLDEGRGWVENNISACLDLAACYDRLEMPREALSALWRSFFYAPPRAEACCAIGSHFLQGEGLFGMDTAGACRTAAYWFQQALSQEPDATMGGFVSPDCYDFLPLLQLCVCYDRLGEHETARAYHERAKALRPDDPMVLYNEAYFLSRAQAGRDASG